jgi:hypothetical protein
MYSPLIDVGTTGIYVAGLNVLKLGFDGSQLATAPLEGRPNAAVVVGDALYVTGLREASYADTDAFLAKYLGSDTAAPTAAPTQSPVANGASWNNTDVTVAWHWSDENSGSGIDPDHCTTSSTSTGQGSIVLSATCQDLAGNVGTASYPVKIDKTPPLVTYTGNANTYTVDQILNITCAASDNLSGVAATTCTNIAGPAYLFGLGVNNFSATATDSAGNAGSGATSFTVRDTVGGLRSLTTQFVTKAGVANSLCADLDAAAAAAARGNAKAAANAIKSYVNDVSAQAGKSLTVDQANLLIRLAKALLG